MPDLGTRLQRELEGMELRPFTVDDFHGRRDRKRRNQRIAAGVVGIAVFVAAIWIVTSIGSLDRSETSVVPGGDVTGPAETGPAETGPTVTGPVIGNTGDPYSVGFEGLPPEGAAPSKPLRGELVMKDGGSNLGSWYAVFVYADGRLIWTRQVPVPEVGEIVIPWIEQRLTQEGVELLRSGAVPLGGEFENPAQGLPASAWEDPTLRPFVPWRYAACLIHRIDGSPTPSLAVDVLPAEAKDVLRRSPWAGASQRRPCREVTLEDARMLVEILSDAGFEQIGDKREEWASGPGGPWSFWMLADPNGNPPNNTGIEFWVILPDGSWYYLVGW